MHGAHTGLADSVWLQMFTHSRDLDESGSGIQTFGGAGSVGQALSKEPGLCPDPGPPRIPVWGGAFLYGVATGGLTVLNGF